VTAVACGFSARAARSAWPLASLGVRTAANRHLLKHPIVALIMTGMRRRIRPFMPAKLASSAMMRHDPVLYRPGNDQVQRQKYIYVSDRIDLTICLWLEARSATATHRSAEPINLAISIRSSSRNRA